MRVCVEVTYEEQEDDGWYADTEREWYDVEPTEDYTAEEIAERIAEAEHLRVGHFIARCTAVKP